MFKKIFDDIKKELKRMTSPTQRPMERVNIQRNSSNNFEVNNIQVNNIDGITALNNIIKSNKTPSFKNPTWNIKIMFGKSSSKNYSKAVRLIKENRTYSELTEDGNINHSAIYTADKDSFLDFYFLYDVVGRWKTTFYMINDELIDRTSIYPLIECYKNKLRSSNNYCYGGVGGHSDNMFGCWQTTPSKFDLVYGAYKKSGRYYILDRSQLTKMGQYYGLCPALDTERINRLLGMLPDRLSHKEYEYMYQKLG